MLTDSVREALRTGRFEGLDLGALYLEALDASGGSRCPHVVSRPSAHPFLGAPTLDLSDFAIGCETRLTHALRVRETSRVFSGEPLGAEKFATLLQLAIGETGDAVADHVGRRPYPSAGALYPIEAFVLVKAVDRVPEGAYHYSPAAHQLHQVRLCAVDLKAFFVASSPEVASPPAAAECVGMLDRAAAAIVLVADVGRSHTQFGEGAWKLALLEAGHVAQNVYLVAAALSGIGVCALAGFSGDTLSAALRLNPRLQRAVYPLIIGATGE